MPAKNPTETRMERRLISVFINAEPAKIILMRPTLVKTDAGGLKKGLAVAQPELTCRLVPFKRRLVQVTVNTPDGDIINLAYVLVGEWNFDIRPADYFEYDGHWYDVFSIEPNTSFRVAANITYRGAQVDDAWGP